MSTPTLTRKVAKESVAAVNKALKAGYVPKGIMAPTGQKGAMAVAADSLGVSPKTFQDRVQRAYQLYQLAPDWSLYREESTTLEIPVATAPAQLELIRLRDENRSLNAEIKSIHRDEISAENVRELIVGLRDGLPDPPNWMIDPKPGGSAGVPLTLWSDWHIGEVVSKEQVGGINEFNIPIARARVKRLVEVIIDLCFNHTVNPEYPGIVVCLGGDMVSGNIHDLPETNDGTLTEQAKECYSLIASSLKALAEKFARIHVVGVVGNHGRMSFKTKSKNRVQDNIEWMLYHFLEAHFHDDKRITFQIPGETDALFEVAGHRFLLTHGDSTGARGGDGIIGAIGPIVRGEKKVRDTASMSDVFYDTALMGHYHQKVSLDAVIVNPSLKGYCEFARTVLRARPERPAQTLIFVHPHYGIIDEKRVWLEKKPPRKAVKFVAVPA